METTFTAASAATQRPKFLTVLCILSFIGIAFGTVWGLANFSSAKAMAEEGGLVSELAAISGIDFSLMANAYLAGAFINIAILPGVLLMWKQKKAGFYVYAAGQTAQVVVPMIIAGGFAGGSAGILPAIASGVFLVLYGLNLKHMK